MTSDKVVGRPNRWQYKLLLYQTDSSIKANLKERVAQKTTIMQEILLLRNVVQQHVDNFCDDVVWSKHAFNEACAFVVDGVMVHVDNIMHNKNKQHPLPASSRSSKYPTKPSKRQRLDCPPPVSKNKSKNLFQKSRSADIEGRWTRG